jgi:hypothetical protein
VRLLREDEFDRIIRRRFEPFDWRGSINGN